MSDAWDKFVSEWLSCERCDLHATRHNVVMGSGDPDAATILLVGEAPGLHEDDTGEAFRGEAGEYMWKLVDEAHVDRSSIYCVNTAGCKPPSVKGQTRPPTYRERTACLPRLRSIVFYVRPKVVLLCGGTAISLVGKVGIERFVGKRASFKMPDGDVVFECPAVMTWHPSHLVRSRERSADDDFKSALLMAAQIARGES